MSANKFCAYTVVVSHLQVFLVYTDYKQSAQHFYKIFYGLNEEESKRNQLAIDVILWQDYMVDAINSNKEWIANSTTRKMRLWTIEIWKLAQDQLDIPYCYSFDKNKSLAALTRVHSNFPVFFLRMIQTMELKKRSKKFKSLNKSSYMMNLQVSSFQGPRSFNLRKRYGT